jgi:hypothetical protein
VDAPVQLEWGQRFVEQLAMEPRQPGGLEELGLVPALPLGCLHRPVQVADWDEQVDVG